MTRLKDFINNQQHKRIIYFGAALLIILVVFLFLIDPFGPPLTGPRATVNAIGTIEKRVYEMQVTQTLQAIVGGTLTALAPTLTPTITLSPTPTPTPTPTVTPQPGTQKVSPNDNMILVYIPAGEFIMGSMDSDIDATDREKPARRVFIDAYWINLTPVTNQMYTLCVKAGICIYSITDTHSAYSDYTDPARANYPVVFIAWEAAQTYCAWQGGRLPTEAEWEKAARGPDGNLYPWGNQPPLMTQSNIDRRILGIVPVGSFLDGRSYYGVLDMGSNIREWVGDWMNETYYQRGHLLNPQGADTGTARVLKGASWDDPVKFSRAANRLSHDPKSPGINRGFRCVIP
jgi:formylglycine-generating enzyme required for sulfatase activity